MKTSNKLLLGLLIAVLVSITVLLGMARIYAVDMHEGAAQSTEAPAPPAAPEPPQASDN